MILVRKSKERGYFDHGWLETAHTFSFGGYRDEAWMGFGPLRVINEDVIAPKMGFSEHGHRDMEIITYPVSGAVRHRDSLGNEEDIVHGMIQRMSAGSGIRHSEFNPLDERTHLLQIWIEPRDAGIEPTHESKAFPILEQPGRLHLLASEDGSNGSLKIEQDARMSAGVCGAGDTISIEIQSGRRVWVQVVSGSVSVLGQVLEVGDGAGISDEQQIELVFDEPSEILVFELA
jgi:quercetin 2,3-dioxygenase